MLYVPGAEHRPADAVSRHPSGDAETTLLIDDIAYISRYTSDSDVLCLPTFTYSFNDTQTSDFVHDDTDEAALYSSAMNAITNLQCVTWDKVCTATSGDVETHCLVETIESGMPDKRTSLPRSIRDYFPLRDQLSTVDGVAIYKDHIIVPPFLRKDILTTLHSAHKGITSMISRAETSVFWPGITSDIISLRNKCNCLIAWPLRYRVPCLGLRCPLYTHSNVHVQIFFTIRVETTL